MTIAAGLVCEGGVVLCVDSQETFGDLKWPVEKLAITRKYGHPVVIAGPALVQESIPRLSASWTGLRADTRIQAFICTTFKRSSVTFTQMICPFIRPPESTTSASSCSSRFMSRSTGVSIQDLRFVSATGQIL